MPEPAGLVPISGRIDVTAEINDSDTGHHTYAASFVPHPRKGSEK